jgi:FkbM family methyltransferase
MEKYFSQFGQDEYLDKKIFKKREKGFFIDIGAHDGITYSNSLFFERYRKWAGICIEPNPDVFLKMAKLRSSLNIEACIGTKHGEVDFLKVSGYAEMLSGMKDNYQKVHYKRLTEEIKNMGGKMEETKVLSIPLRVLCEKYSIKHVHYISLDVEGGELAVLNSINFKTISVDVFSVENNYEDNEIRSKMKEEGYYLKKKIKCDEIYVKRSPALSFFYS